MALEKEGGPEAEGTTQVEPRDADAAAGAKGPAGSDESAPADTERAAAAAARAGRAPGAGEPPAAAPRHLRRRPAAQAAPTATAATSTGDPDARMTPAVRRLLREHALRPDQIVGTGGGGRITRDDVLAVVESIRTGGTPPVPVMAQGNGATAPAAGPGPRRQPRRPRPPHRPACRPAPGSSSPRAPTRSSSR